MIDDGTARTSNTNQPVHIILDDTSSNFYSPPLSVYRDDASMTSPTLAQNYHSNNISSHQLNSSIVTTNKSSVSTLDKSSSASPSNRPAVSSRNVTIIEETHEKARVQDNRTMSALSRSSISSSASSSTKNNISKSNINRVQIIAPSHYMNTPTLVYTNINNNNNNNNNNINSSNSNNLNHLKLFKSLDESSDLSEHSDSTTSSLSSFEVLNDSTNAAIVIANTGLSTNGAVQSLQSITLNMNHVGDGVGALHVDDELSYNTTDDVDIAATLGEHVSTITSAPVAMQSDLDVASSSIPSNSSKSPTNVTDRYYRRFKKRAAALDGLNTTSTAANILLGAMTIHPVSSIISNRSTSADDSISVTTPTGSAATASSSIYRNRAVDRDQFRMYILQGDVANARLILRNYSTTNRNNLLLDANEATDLMIQLFSTRSENINFDVIKLLVDGLNANINGVELLSGRRPLHYAVDLNHAEVGSFLITRGADVFIQDNTGASPLVMSLNNQLTWLLQAYEDSGMQSKMLTSDNTTQISEYTTSLVQAGYSKYVSSLLKSGQITITPKDATLLLNSCHGNFENMLEPIDMFELLESLGASM